MILGTFSFYISYDKASCLCILFSKTTRIAKPFPTSIPGHFIVLSNTILPLFRGQQIFLWLRFTVTKNINTDVHKISWFSLHHWTYSYLSLLNTLRTTKHYSAKVNLWIFGPRPVDCHVEPELTSRDTL